MVVMGNMAVNGDKRRLRVCAHRNFFHQTPQHLSTYGLRKRARRQQRIAREKSISKLRVTSS